MYSIGMIEYLFKKQKLKYLHVIIIPIILEGHCLYIIIL